MVVLTLCLVQDSGVFRGNTIRNRRHERGWGSGTASDKTRGSEIKTEKILTEYLHGEILTETSGSYYGSSKWGPQLT